MSKTSNKHVIILVTVHTYIHHKMHIAVRTFTENCSFVKQHITCMHVHIDTDAKLFHQRSLVALLICAGPRFIVLHFSHVRFPCICFGSSRVFSRLLLIQGVLQTTPYKQYTSKDTALNHYPPYNT